MGGAGADEPWTQRALNNNVDGPNADALDWDDFSDEDLVGSAYRGNRSPKPSNGGVRSIHGLEDYDDIRSGDDGSDGNVHNRNDNERDGNV
jgi:hypothetical protein